MRAQQVMYNKSNLGDTCYVCNISNYTNRILETSTYLTGGISLPKVFPTLQSRGHCPTKAQESYVWLVCVVWTSLYVLNLLNFPTSNVQ